MIVSILKIIGIVFLVILLIIIFILGVLLFVPIRYRFEGTYFEEPDGVVYVRFAPVGLKLECTFRNKKLRYTMKLLGGVVMTNTDAKLSWIGRRFFSFREEEDDIKTDHIKADDIKADQTKADDAPEGVIENPNIENLPDSDREYTAEIKNQKYQKQSFWQKQKATVSSIKEKTRQFIKKIKQINNKKEALLKVYHSKRFEVAKEDIKVYAKELFRILKPDKLEGNVHFGMDDPAVTGEILGGLALILPLYQNYLTIRPDFEKQCLDGSLKGNGRLYLISVLKLALKIVFNKNFIKVTKKVQTIIEA
ncbi:MAG: DUF2953 domain-containing protein [Lachnospiraceae bacterium]